ncbi:MAG: ABC transporter ATP-binding protein [Armatimonadetes bacterium]|nr:ABC transporter ATP-binding protein [Armatimonadota bacterium]
MSQHVIETSDLGRRFRKAWAIQNLNLQVPAGSVFGFLGLNGAGKTTTIRMLLGLLEPSVGSISVLGMNPLTHGVEIRRRVGYVAENQKMYGWMTVEETLRFVRPFYPTWNDSLAAELLRRFGLSPSAKLRTLSAGMNAKVALTLALAHEPELLVLDDPTSGLDAVVRREFLESIIGIIHEEGRTVFFSSHIINEVERVADWVGIIHEGTLKIAQPLESLKTQMKRLRLIFPSGCPDTVEIPGLLSTQKNGRETLLTVQGFSDATLRTLEEEYTPQTIEVHDLSLEDIFVETVKGGEPGHEEPALEGMA